MGAAYTFKPTNTVLRVSYARTLETPFNENLVLSSNGCQNEVLNPLLACSGSQSGTLAPGYRNEFHAGLQQAFGKNFVISGDYIWKYTHNAFDFSVLGNTPITFPIDWHNSKIPGFALRADVPNFHNISAFVVMSSVAARFFPPQSRRSRSYRRRERTCHSASTTTSASTSPRTCSIRCPSSVARGSASTGDSTAALPPALCPATTTPAIQTADAAHATLPDGTPADRPERT